MAENKEQKELVPFASGAALATAIAALMKKPAAAAFSLDEETRQILAAMAATQAEILGLLQGLNLQGYGYPPNTPTMSVGRTTCTLALTPYQLDEIIVPDGFRLLFRAWHLNAGLIYIGKGPGEAMNPGASYPLTRGETAWWNIQSSRNLWVVSTVAGDSVHYTAEQRS
jgi:hypothetical protein